MARIAIVEKDKCKSDKCNFACHKACPVVRSGTKECIQLDNNSKAIIDETLCTGCGICPKVCPFGALSIINLPEALDSTPVHQFGQNGFRIFNLPIIHDQKVTGLIGRNGIGKSTVINILSGLLKANFGEKEEENNEEYYSKLNNFFKGTVLQTYFDRLKKGEITVSYKPQHILEIKDNFSGKVNELLSKVASTEKIHEIAEKLDLNEILDRDIKKLSGGELQKVAIAATLLKSNANFFVFDEISNYLDVYQRLNSSRTILEEIKGKTSLVVEHDLIVLDYLGEYVHIMYGEPGAYGMLSGIKGVKNGINDYLYGYSKEENVRFREKSITFEKDSVIEDHKKNQLAAWEEFSVDKGEFHLDIKEGEIKEGEVIGIIGRNGLGKSTMIEKIAKEGIGKGELNISYKPQLMEKNDNLVMAELSQFKNYNDNFYQIYVLEPLRIKEILEKEVNQLSGGEFQRFAIARALLQEAEIYLLDEPTAFLDVEDRLKIARIIKNFIETKKKSAMIIDHDLVFLDYLSDNLLVFQGKPGIKGLAHPPKNMRDGMNLFLEELGITFRRDENNKRPRTNKVGSVKDMEQKQKGEYYYS